MVDTPPLDPLPSTEKLVNENGTPTEFFQRKWAGQQELNVSYDDLVTLIATLQAEVAALQAINLTAGTGLDGGGDLTADRAFDLANTAVTPGDYTNSDLSIDAQGRVTAAADGSGGGGDFLSLTDTPASYSGEAGKVAQVNPGETALEFATPLGSTQFIGDGRFAPPDPAAFGTADNHKAGTTWNRDTYGGTTLMELNDTSNQHIASLKAIPTGSWTATFRVVPMYVENTGSASVGFQIRESSTGKTIDYRFVAVGGESWMYISNYTNDTWNANLAGNKDLHKEPAWIQIEDDTVNFTFRYSVDGVNWKDMVTVGRTAHMAAADQIGFFLMTQQAPSAINILYYDDKDDPASTPTVPIALDDLNNVSLAGLTDAEFLQYDTGTGEWKNFDLFATANVWGAAQTIGAFDFTVDTDTLFVDASDDAVRIGATARDAAALWSRLQIYGVNASASGPHVSITTDADTYPLMYALAYSHDNMGILFDSYYDGGWKSSDVGSNYSIYKNADKLQFQYKSGVAAGGTISWSDALVIDTNGDIELPTGDLNLTVGGIHIGGAGAANYFDDYEEGTWTPTFDTFNNDAAGITYDQQWGTYRKIGNVVFIKGRIRTDVWTTAGTGNLRIEGLPFAAGSPGGVQAESINIYWSLAWGGPIPTQLVVNAGANYMGLVSDQIGTAVPSTDRVNAANSNDIIFNGYYMT